MTDVANDAQRALTEAPVEALAASERKAPKRGAPKWESDARARLRGALKKAAQPLQGLLEHDANEMETRLLVRDLLAEGFGFDRYREVGAEYEVRSQYVDYTLRVNDDLFAFIEVKRCGVKLNEKHLRQVKGYALDEGSEWLVLTNGAVWRIYHMQMDRSLPVELVCVVDVDLTDGRTPAQHATDLFPITREAVKHGALKSLWVSRRATSPKALASALLSDPVVKALRNQLRKDTGERVDLDTIVENLRENVIRADAQP